MGVQKRLLAYILCQEAVVGISQLLISIPDSLASTMYIVWKVRVLSQSNISIKEAEKIKNKNKQTKQRREISLMYALGRGTDFGSYELKVDLRVDLKLKTWRWREDCWRMGLSFSSCQSGTYSLRQDELECTASSWIPGLQDCVTSLRFE